MKHILNFYYIDKRIPNKPWHEKAILKFEQIFDKILRERNLNLNIHLSLDEDEFLSFQIIRAKDNPETNRAYLYFCLGEDETESFCGLVIREEDKFSTHGINWKFTPSDYETQINKLLDILKEKNFI